MGNYIKNAWLSHGIMGFFRKILWTPCVIVYFVTKVETCQARSNIIPAKYRFYWMVFLEIEERPRAIDISICKTSKLLDEL